MKKILAALAVAALASTASALAPAHDLTVAVASGGYGGTNGSCQYCHAPHLWASDATLTGVAPLWNRAAPTSTFSPYTSTTLRGSIVVGPNSLTCLTCHDGITALGTLLNGSLATDPILNSVIAARVVGTDLSDDHPVGVGLIVQAGAYKAPSIAKLYTTGGENRVECASCHEPHATVTSLLRGPRAALCADCHEK